MKRTLLSLRVAVSLFLVSGFFAFVPLSAASDFFLHSSTNDFLDNTSPAATTAKFKDSPAVNRTTYQQIGIWSAAALTSAQTLNSLSDLHVWIGLKNSDDQGTNFDLKAEIRKNGVPIASGETKNIQGVTRNSSNAKEVAVTFGAIANNQLNAGDVLSIAILTKVADSGGHSNAVGLRLYYDASSRPSRFGALFGTTNQAPVATNDAYNTDEDTTLSIFAPGVLGNDTDVDTPAASLTAILVTGPSHAASFTLNADGSFSYTPEANFNGTDSFTYKVNDGASDSNVATVTITVNAVSDAPVAANDFFNTDEDTTLEVPAPGVLANDNDIDTPQTSLTAILVTEPSRAASFTLNPDGSFSYTPEANFNGADSFTYKANDGANDSNVAMVTIAVNPVNDAPVAQNDNYTVAEDSVLSVAAPGVLDNDTDPDLGQTLTVEVVSGPTHALAFTLNADGSFAYTPQANFFGVDTFTYRAFDGTAYSNVAMAQIAVTNVNNAPVAQAQSVSTNQNTPVIITLSATDIDSAALNFNITMPQSQGSLGLIGASNCVPAGKGTACTANGEGVKEKGSQRRGHHREGVREGVTEKGSNLHSEKVSNLYS